jgi:hypothetical protein
MKAYPFLFTKNRFLENGPVVQPDFFDREAALFLGDVARGQPMTATGQAYYLACDHSTLGPLHVVFRKRLATAADLGQAGTEPLGDESGRRFYHTEGFVVRGAEPGFEKDFAYSPAHLNAAHEVLLPKFRRFWRSKEWRDAQCLSSLSIDLTPDLAHKLLLLPQNAFSAHAMSNLAQEAAETAAKGAASAAHEAETAEKAAASAGREGRPSARELRPPISNQTLVFAAVALAALGAFIAARLWRRHHRRTILILR